MITVLIAAENVWQKEQLASCVLRRVDDGVTLLCPKDSEEALEMAKDWGKHHVDMFIISVRLKPMGGRKLADTIRGLFPYEKTPILFLTDTSYDLVGFSYLSTKHGHGTHNYISMPLDKIDAQGKIGLYLEDIIANQLNHQKANPSFLLHHQTGAAIVAVSDIFYAEVQNKVCSLHTKKGVFQVKRKGLTEIVALVHSDSFVRCHKSYALNVDHLNELTRLDKRIWNARFEGTSDLCPVSKTYCAALLASLERRKNATAARWV